MDQDGDVISWKRFPITSPLSRETTGNIINATFVTHLLSDISSVSMFPRDERYPFTDHNYTLDARQTSGGDLSA